ncbi:MAG TPA: response regulator transcription factor [Rhodospirillaceae bacterium]|nr:response regulator transcription factor [Rhodospirillaceae bacterium]
MGEKEQAVILIADDHPLYRDALRNVVGEVFVEYRCVEVDTCDKAIAAIAAENLELIFLDLKMPGMIGFNGLVAIRNALPSVPVIVISASDDTATVTEAITYGASGFIPKSLSREEMVAAVQCVLDGRIFTPKNLSAAGDRQLGAADADLANSISQLTHQQRVVLQMLVNGRPNKQIAYELNIVESTVKAHVSAILRKLRVHSRTQAVVKASKILSLLGNLDQTRMA